MTRQNVGGAVAIVATVLAVWSTSLFAPRPAHIATPDLALGVASAPSLAYPASPPTAPATAAPARPSTTPSVAPSLPVASAVAPSATASPASSPTPGDAPPDLHGFPAGVGGPALPASWARIA